MAEKFSFDFLSEAEDAEWQAKYRRQLADERAALEARDGQPPRHSRVKGPPADWNRWCCLLDGVPVGSCTEFDADAGWVQVWPLTREQRRPGGRARSATANQRRLFGVVTVVLCDEYHRLEQERGSLDIYEDEDRGEEIPGTDIGTLSRSKHAAEAE